MPSTTMRARRALTRGSAVSPLALRPAPWALVWATLGAAAASIVAARADLTQPDVAEPARAPDASGAVGVSSGSASAWSPVREDYIIEKARRAYDARQYLVTLVETLNVTRARGAEDGADFYAVFSQQEADHLLWVGANRDGAPLNVTRDASVDVPGFVHYRVAVGSGIPISDSHTPGVLFNVTSVFSGAKQRPDPEECDKDEQHASVVQINAYLATPYIVKQTLSTAHLSSNREVIGTPTGPKPVIAVSFYGARSRWGPYHFTPTYTHADAAVHAKTFAPFAVAERVRRVVDASHALAPSTRAEAAVGADGATAAAAPRGGAAIVSIEEAYTLVHTGAALPPGTVVDEAEFADWAWEDRHRPEDEGFLVSVRGNGVLAFTQRLPNWASSVRVHDAEGNVTTTALHAVAAKVRGGYRVPGGAHLELEVRPRRPFIGGGAVLETTTGYAVPAARVLARDGDGAYTLTVDANAAMLNLEIEDYALTVVLPARAAVTSVDVRGLPKPSVTVSADPPSVEVTSARIVSGSMGSESPHAGAIAVTFNLP